MGHRLTLGFAEWQCVATLESGVPTAVVLEVQLPSLQVIDGVGGLKPLGSVEKRMVHDSALKTLRVKDHPTARWTSSSVAASPGGFELAGSLSLHGQDHPCPVRVTVTGDQVAGTASVLQTGWGVKPYSQMMGTLQVSDLVDVLVEVTVPQP
ncbi:MAG: S-adenosyl-L-methionine-dependent methyltransferase [Frankiales bacterium]|nr:S-adenosyl-L-methionine-dependent methyltransferase [Frankiales bacterium]